MLPWCGSELSSRGSKVDDEAEALALDSADERAAVQTASGPVEDSDVPEARHAAPGAMEPRVHEPGLDRLDVMDVSAARPPAQRLGGILQPDP